MKQIEEAIKIVADHFKVTPEVIKKSSGYRVAYMRHIVFYLCRKRYPLISLVKVSECLGYSDHTTGVKAISKIKGRLKIKEEKCTNDIAALKPFMNIKFEDTVIYGNRRDMARKINTLEQRLARVLGENDYLKDKVKELEAALVKKSKPIVVVENKVIQFQRPPAVYSNPNYSQY